MSDLLNLLNVNGDFYVDIKTQNIFYVKNIYLLGLDEPNSTPTPTPTSTPTPTPTSTPTPTPTNVGSYSATLEPGYMDPGSRGYTSGVGSLSETSFEGTTITHMYAETPLIEYPVVVKTNVQISGVTQISMTADGNVATLTWNGTYYIGDNQTINELIWDTYLLSGTISVQLEII